MRFVSEDPGSAKCMAILARCDKRLAKSLRRAEAMELVMMNNPGKPGSVFVARSRQFGGIMGSRGCFF